ncbi:hypothetical protein Ato02nite_028030 [Paractinoplanes toevensis]|uniref:Uncharacterized protein n=1 Tax=Paractinoplanes toevensis TaxID=571911 RepID=A0A919W3Y4_9ACTN|nr:hypothetical protein Ato02nite_028030 [Actinoplanes toevensis]
MPAGMFDTIEPTPISATIRPAAAIVAPRSIALITITGAMTPWENPESRDGPYAETATDLSRKVVSLAMPGIFRAGRTRDPHALPGRWLGHTGGGFTGRRTPRL